MSAKLRRQPPLSRDYPLKRVAAEALAAHELTEHQRQLQHEAEDRQRAHRELATALTRYLGIEEEVVGQLLPPGQDWAVVDGLRVWWAKRTPYTDGWFAGAGYGDGNLYVGRPQPGCARVNCAVPGYEGAHLDWISLHHGTPDFDLPKLGEWLATPARATEDADIACPYCAREAADLRASAARQGTEAIIVGPAGKRLVAALAAFIFEHRATD